MWYAYAVGFAYAIIVGQLLIEPVMFFVWRYRDQNGQPNWQKRVIGIMERIFYISSLLMGYGEFIGFWLALKMAWHLWVRGREARTSNEGREARTFYMDTLIGNAVSLLYAGVGFQMIVWIKNEEWLYAALVPSLLIGATGYFCQYLEKEKKTPKP